MKFRSAVMLLSCVCAVLPPVSQAASRRNRANTPPTISGTPVTTAVAGSAYAFTPSASDANNDRLRFNIANKPAWAAFSGSTGKLSGAPTTAQAGTYSNIRISVSDGRARTYLPTFSLTVSNPTSTGTTNRAPVISGTPTTSVIAGNAYAFRPTASDADADMLSFSVSGKPAWAAFSISDGSLTGAPSLAQAGSYPSVVITVSDGKVSKSLAAFGITVSSPASSGSATLSWTAPTLNTDGSSLTDLGGYRIYHGTSASAMNDVRIVATPATTTYQFTSLAAGTHYFSITAYNTAGIESSQSAVGSKGIP
jgi:hypothetical protein